MKTKHQIALFAAGAISIISLLMLTGIIPQPPYNYFLGEPDNCTIYESYTLVSGIDTLKNGKCMYYLEQYNNCRYLHDNSDILPCGSWRVGDTTYYEFTGKKEL